MANNDTKDFRNNLLLFYLDKLADMEQADEFDRFYDDTFEQFVLGSDPSNLSQEDLMKCRNILTYEKTRLKGIAI